jgi:hypothetical protein
VPAATDIPYTAANTSAFSVPSILSSAWQSPQGDAALIFTNISDSAVQFSWTVSAADIPLDASERYSLYILTNGVCTSAQRAVHLPYTLSLNTNSTDVVMALFSGSALGGTPPFSGCTCLAEGDRVDREGHEVPGRNCGRRPEYDLWNEPWTSFVAGSVGRRF